MNEKILYEFKMPMIGYGEILYRVVSTDHFNILQIIWGEYTIPIPLVGHTPNYFFELGGMISTSFASSNKFKNILPNFKQLPKPIKTPQSNTVSITEPPTTSSSVSNQPVTFRSKQQRKLNEITIDDAVAILKGIKAKPEKYVNVAITEETMVDFIIKYKGGSELYINGEYKEFKDAKLFINFDLFRKKTLQLFNDNKIVKKTKISKKRKQKYDVFLIPKELPDGPGKPAVESYQPKLNPLLIKPSQISAFSSTSEVKLSITNYLESLFYSFQDSELNLEIFLSEAQYQKIPLDVAKNFYIKKLEERDKRLRRLHHGTANNVPS